MESEREREKLRERNSAVEIADVSNQKLKSETYLALAVTNSLQLVETTTLITLF